MKEPAGAPPRRRWRLGHLFLVLIVALAAREVWRWFGPGSGGGLGSSSRAEPVDAETLVLVTLDSVARDRLATFGGSGLATPALDRFASAGAATAELMVTSTGTNASLATLFTGLDPTEHGVTSLHRIGRHRLRKSVETLTEELGRDHRTAGFAGLVQLGPTISGLEQGFELFLTPTLPGLRLSDAQILERPELEHVLSLAEPVFLWIHLSDTRAVELPEHEPEVVAAILAEHLMEVARQDADVRAALDRARTEPDAAIGALEASLGRQRGRPERAALEEALYDLRLRSLDGAFGALVERLDERRPRARWIVCGTQGWSPDGSLADVWRAPFFARGFDAANAATGCVRSEAVARWFTGAEPPAGDGTLFVRNDAEQYVWLDESGHAELVRTADGFAFDAAGAQRELAGSGLAIQLGDDVDGSFEVYARLFETGWLEQRRDGEPIEPGPLGLPVERERLRDASERLGGSVARGVCIETLGERPALRLSLVGDERHLRDLAVDGWGPWALPRVALAARDPWPVDEAGEPVPPTVDVGRVVGRTLGAVVGPEPHSTADEEAELLIGVWPPDEAARFEVKPGPRVFLQVAPGRPHWVLAKGATPLTVEIEKPPSAQLALAARVAGRNVGVDEMRFLGERLTKAGRAVVLLPAWLPGLTDTTPTAPPTAGATSGVRLSVWGPAVPPDAWSLCGDAAARFLERLEATE